jgi:hypothetical protein
VTRDRASLTLRGTKARLHLHAPLASNWGVKPRATAMRTRLWHPQRVPLPSILEARYHKMGDSSVHDLEKLKKRLQKHIASIQELLDGMMQDEAGVASREAHRPARNKTSGGEVQNQISDVQEDGHGQSRDSDASAEDASDSHDHDARAIGGDRIVSQDDERLTATEIGEGDDDQGEEKEHDGEEPPEAGTDEKEEQLVDPIFTRRQRELLVHYDLLGVFGLIQVIREIAVYEQTQERDAGIFVSRAKKRKHAASPASPGHISWQRLIEDIDLGLTSRALFYLCSIPSLVIPALIRGDLPRQMQDQGFRTKVGPHIRPSLTQGAYVIYLALLPSYASTQGNDMYAGCGLSLKQLLKVIAAMKVYSNVNDPDSATFAQKVDTRFGEKKDLDYKRQRRYAAGGDHCDLTGHVWWIDNFQYTYLYWAIKRAAEDEDDPRLAQYLLRCLVYVGLAGLCEDRINDHATHSGDESVIFGLFCAIVEALYPGSFGVRDTSFQIFKTVSNEDIGLEEILLSVLTSALPADGGLNYAHCGGSLGNYDRKDPAAQAARLKKNAQSIEKHRFLDENIDDAYIKWRKFKDAPQQYQKAVAQRNFVMRMLQESEKLLADMESKIGTLDSEENALFHELEQALRDFMLGEEAA